MRSQYLGLEEISRLFYYMQKPNVLACKISMQTGLRIGDCLAIEKSKLKERITVIEEKTGYTKRVYIGKKLLRQLLQFSKNNKSKFLFPHRFDKTKHRTRQAVFLDIKKAGALLGLKEHISPHTFRKFFAVRFYRRVGSLEKTQKRLGHKKLETTLLYALSDKI